MILSQKRLQKSESRKGGVDSSLIIRLHTRSKNRKSTRFAKKKGTSPEFSLDGYHPYFKHRANPEEGLYVGSMIEDPGDGLAGSAQCLAEVGLVPVAVFDATLDLFHDMRGRAFVSD